MDGLIAAHGGRLVNCLSKGPLQGADGLPAIVLPEREQCDVEMIGIGAFSPLAGFMGRADFDSVCDHMRLADGTPWPIPITCSVDAATAGGISVGQKVALKSAPGRVLAVLTVTEKYDHDTAKEVTRVYRTDSPEHPGVDVTLKQGAVCLAGPVEVHRDPGLHAFSEFQLTPAQTRAEFEKRGWRTVVAFQTRNPIHRAHEYLTKCALEICDGLLIHPLVGQTQAGDIPPDVRMRCYDVLIKKYYVPERTLLAVMPAAMRYAGPREAILHALVRQNYGCTHFIVGRDHAGVGSYYGTYDAQKIFDSFAPGDIAITPLKFEHATWCQKCEGMVSGKTCPHPGEDKIFLSGTKVREMLSAGQRPPMEFSRPEVADILIDAMQSAG